MPPTVVLKHEWLFGPHDRHQDPLTWQNPLLRSYVTIHSPGTFLHQHRMATVIDPVEIQSHHDCDLPGLVWRWLDR